MEESTIVLLTWIGIAFCLTQSAMFSGLNLAFFGLSRLRLEIEAKTSSRARRVLEMRKDSNFLLTTILWGNVGINVLLTLLTDSLLAGAMAFLFSTFAITLFGEIIPQAYFSRHAMAMASMLSPVLRFYQRLLWPVAKPAARMLDHWLGKEAPQFMREHVVHEMLLQHIQAEDTDLDIVEGTGAANFLAIDDLTAWDEGELLAPSSIVTLPKDVDLPRFPAYNASADDPFLRKINASGEKWVVLTDDEGEPRLLMDADGFLRAALLGERTVNPYEFCHRPIVVQGEDRSLGWVIQQLAIGGKQTKRGVMEKDVVLVWGKTPRIITGADILGRLLDGIDHS
ncbi:MAG: DUF21 domain-containing protein [Xanthomonadales bacterium]|nr:DUF21 domain-containing protein [Gammaproteobacteria bacterium]NNE06240.1 DUF21 domain-containing protein [Xanthomonadales bacterium]NNL94000.1 DUF21 domain-containing protein [Xanthomonadales bacterium]